MVSVARHWVGIPRPATHPHPLHRLAHLITSYPSQSQSSGPYLAAECSIEIHDPQHPHHLITSSPHPSPSLSQNQLDRILEVTGRPKKADIDAVGSSFAMTMLDELPTPKQRNLEHMFPNASPEATDLLRKLLVFNPDKRMTAEEALSHPYVAQFHDPATEPRCSRVITIPINDNTKFTIQEYRERLYQEIVRRKKELKRRIKERDAQRAASKGKDLQQVQKEVEQAQVLARTPSTTDGEAGWGWGGIGCERVRWLAVLGQEMGLPSWFSAITPCHMQYHMCPFPCPQVPSPSGGGGRGGADDRRQRRRCRGVPTQSYTHPSTAP